MNDFPHPILPNAFLFQVIGLNLQVDPTDWRKSYVELTLLDSRDDTRKKLRFLRPRQLYISPDLPFPAPSLEILDVSGRQWEEVTIEVTCAEGAVLSFFAQGVEEII